VKDALSKKEAEVVRWLLKWDSLRRKPEWIVCNISLLLAGTLIVSSAVLTLSHLNDHIILVILVPSFLVGSLFAGLYILGIKRIRERHELASVIRKLESGV